MRFQIDVDTNRIIPRLEEALMDGAEESVEALLDHGQEGAQDRIKQRRRIWQREVYHGWTDSDTDRRWNAVSGTKRNVAPHASIVQSGRRPGQTAPQVQDIIEWVDDKIDGTYTYDGDDGGALPPDHPGHALVTHDENSVEQYRTAEDFGLPSSATWDNIYIIDYDNGDRGIFKPLDQWGIARNEETFSRFVEYFGWNEDDGFPTSRLREVDLPDTGKTTGTIQEWVFDTDPASDIVDTGRSPLAYLPPSEFATKNGEFLGRMGVLDYLTGNDDRHMSNIVMDIDEIPWAIDSGGAGESTWSLQKFRLNRLIGPPSNDMMDTEIDGQYAIQHPDELKAAIDAMIDRQEQFLQYLSDNPEIRDDLIWIASRLHGEDSAEHGTYEKLLADDSTFKYAMFVEREEWGNQELWQHDIAALRERVEDQYLDRIGSSSATDTKWDAPEHNPWEVPDEPLDQATLELMLDDLLGTL